MTWQEIVAGAVQGSLMPSVSLAMGIVGAVQNKKARQIDEKNFQLQRDAYEHNKWLQGQTWEREDNAVQRRVADLSAAGINPLLAAGQPAASSPGQQVSAPQRKMSHNEQALLAMQSMSQLADISHTLAQNDLIRLQQKHVRSQMLSEGQQRAAILQQMAIDAYNLKVSQQNKQRTTDHGTFSDIATAVRHIGDIISKGPNTGAAIDSIKDIFKPIIDANRWESYRSTPPLEEPTLDPMIRLHRKVNPPHREHYYKYNPNYR